MIDVTLAFPVLLLALGIASACSLGSRCARGLIKPGLPTVIVAIVVINWTYIGRIIRGQVLSLREKEFVEAARATGAGDTTILLREILPNLVAPIVVYTTLIIPQNILLEAALSYLGVGINPPQASWGQMIADATPIFSTAWWYFAFPGAALLLTVLAFNLVGDGVRDALDPRMACPRLPGRRKHARHPQNTRPPKGRRAAGARRPRGNRPARADEQRGRRRTERGRAPRGGTITVLSAGDVDHIDPGQAYYSFSYEIAYATQRPLLAFRPSSVNAVPDLAAAAPTVSQGGRRSPCTSARACASARR